MDNQPEKNQRREKRFDYWNYLTNEKTARPRGVTDLRMMNIKREIINDDDFWFQVIDRNGAEELTATEFYQSNSAAEHSRGNFWAMLKERITLKKTLVKT